MASVLWELEGELLHIAMKCDKLRKKDGLSPEEKADLEDMKSARPYWSGNSGSIA